MAKKKSAQKKAPKQKPSATAVVSEKTLADFAAKLKPAEIRFIHLYLGGEGGACWNNATRAYCVAYEKDENDTKELKTCSTLGSRLLGKVEIQDYKRFLLGKHGFTEDSIKQRYGQLSMQDSNIGVALGATDRIAKIAGVLKDDGLKVDIPQLVELGKDIKKILSGGRAS